MRAPSVAVYRDDDRLTTVCRQILESFCRVRFCRQEAEALLAASTGDAHLLVTDFEVAGRSAEPLVAHLWSLREDAHVLILSERSAIPIAWLECLREARSNIQVVTIRPGTDGYSATTRRTLESAACFLLAVNGGRDEGEEVADRMGATGVELRAIVRTVVSRGRAIQRITHLPLTRPQRNEAAKEARTLGFRNLSAFVFGVRLFTAQRVHRRSGWTLERARRLYGLDTSGNLTHRARNLLGRGLSSLGAFLESGRLEEPAAAPGARRRENGSPRKR